MGFWEGFEKRALSPEFARQAATGAIGKLQAAIKQFGHDSPQALKLKARAQRFADYSRNKLQGAMPSAFAGVAQKAEPNVINYAKIQAQELAAKRAKSEALGSTINYANRRNPVVTPNVQPLPKPTAPDPAAWSKINQVKRNRMLEQERTGVIR